MPIKLTVQETWPDGSILNGEVIFVASTSKQASYLLCYGDDVKGSKRMEKNVIYNQPECIMCMRCVEICPRKDCLSVSCFGKKITGSRF
ncbi:MAG: hypothetical protein AB2L14_10830 [Candidatus Xenobiia bacterium LiM19]